MSLLEERDGLEIFEMIRQLFLSQRALLVSGHAPNDRMQAAIDRGLGWLAKPYTIESLQIQSPKRWKSPSNLVLGRGDLRSPFGRAHPPPTKGFLFGGAACLDRGQRKWALRKAHPGHEDRHALAGESPWAAPACFLLIIFAACAAYYNSFSGPFVFDDNAAIVDNPSIRHLWPITRAMVAPLAAAGATGRPLVNLSLAVNYALGGTNVVGYHVVNLLFHVAVALVLFSLVCERCGCHR